MNPSGSQGAAELSSVTGRSTRLLPSCHRLFEYLCFWQQFSFTTGLRKTRPWAVLLSFLKICFSPFFPFIFFSFFFFFSNRLIPCVLRSSFSQPQNVPAASRCVTAGVTPHPCSNPSPFVCVTSLSDSPSVIVSWCWTRWSWRVLSNLGYSMTPSPALLSPVEQTCPSHSGEGRKLASL